MKINIKSLINVKSCIIMACLITVSFGWGVKKIILPLSRVDGRVRPYFKRVYFADLRFWEYTMWGDVFSQEVKKIRQDLTADERVLFFYYVYLYCNIETDDWVQFVESVLHEDMPRFIVELEKLPQSPDYAMLSESKRKMLSSDIKQFIFLLEEINSERSPAPISLEDGIKSMNSDDI